MLGDSSMSAIFPILLALSSQPAAQPNLILVKRTGGTLRLSNVELNSGRPEVRPIASISVRQDEQLEMICSNGSLWALKLIETGMDDPDRVWAASQKGITIKSPRLVVGRGRHVIASIDLGPSLSPIRWEGRRLLAYFDHQGSASLSFAGINISSIPTGKFLPAHAESDLEKATFAQKWILKQGIWSTNQGVRVSVEEFLPARAANRGSVSPSLNRILYYSQDPKGNTLKLYDLATGRARTLRRAPLIKCGFLGDAPWAITKKGNQGLFEVFDSNGRVTRTVPCDNAG